MGFTLDNSQRPKALIIIFGATGDLAKRKLFPSIFHLCQHRQMCGDFAVVGIGRRDWTNERFRETVAHGVEKAFSPEQRLDNFNSNFYYHSIDLSIIVSYQDFNYLVINLDNNY